MEIEVVVVDDGSSDGTAEYLAMLADQRVRVFQQAHQGPQVARNRGLDEARGAYVKFLDDDDWLAPGALPCELAELRKHGADLSCGDLILVDELSGKSLVSPGARGRDFFAELVRGAVSTLPSRFMVRTELARSVGWNPMLTIRQDLDYFFRIVMKSSNQISVPVTVAYFRTHNRGARVSATGAKLAASSHLSIIMKVLQELAVQQEYRSEERMAALMASTWHWAHVCAVSDLRLAKRGWDLVEGITPQRYHPFRKSAILRICDTTLGPKKTELLMVPLRLLKQKCLIRFDRSQ